MAIISAKADRLDLNDPTFRVLRVEIAAARVKGPHSRRNPLAGPIQIGGDLPLAAHLPGGLMPLAFPLLPPLVSSGVYDRNQTQNP